MDDYPTIGGMTAAAGYVLVGGRSSRFGSDKALYEVEGKPLALHTAEKVRRAAGSVALLGAPSRYGHLGLRVIPDPVEGFGPLAGIVAALEDCTAERALVVAVDLPGVTADLLRYLLSWEGEVVLPVQPDGYDQPLCAVYGRGVLPALRRALEAGRGSVMRALDGVPLVKVRPEEYAAFGGGELFRNWNQPPV